MRVTYWEGLIADEMLLVVVLPEFLKACHNLLHIEVWIDLLAEQTLHLIEIGGVAARAAQATCRLLSRRLHIRVNCSAIDEQK